MTKDQLIEIRKRILDERKVFTDKQDEEWTKAINEFHDQHVPYSNSQVVEVVKAKKHKRMVIYAIETQFWPNDGTLTFICGWYLDENNIPYKWEGGIAVLGVSNPTELKLSENQTHLPVPKNLANR